MENNENIELVEAEVNDNTELTEVNQNQSVGTGLAMLAGGCIAAALIAGGIKLKKVWDKRHEIFEDDPCFDEFVDVEAEEVKEETKEEPKK